MQVPDTEARKAWIDQISAYLVCSEEEAVEYVLDRARTAAAAGVLAMPGMDQEESRALNVALLHGRRIGIEAAAPDGFDEADVVDDADVDDPALNARAALTAALREEGLPAQSDVEQFRLGVGAGSGAIILATIASIIVIVKDAGPAWENVKRWARALKKTLALTDHVRATVETLKLICVDDVIQIHPDLTALDPELIAATVAVRVDRDTGVEDTEGPVYIIVPVAEMGKTYAYAVTWSGRILHRAAMPFVREGLDEPNMPALLPGDANDRE